MKQFKNWLVSLIARFRTWYCNNKKRIVRMRRILCYLISSRIVQRLKRWSVRKPWRASFYFLLTGTFGREHQAVLAGMLAHGGNRDESTAEAKRFRLRRCIHRLEKGLIMRPRRHIFALSYITETMDLFEESSREAGGCGEEGEALNAWAFDVLHQYFQVVGDDPSIDAAKLRYREIAKRLGREPGDSRPYTRDLAPLSIKYDDLLALAMRRRSVRWYLSKSVPREMIDKAVQTAGYSPSACNRQPFEFHIYDDPELIRRIAEIPMGTAGFYEQFPCVVVLIGRMDAFEYERDRHLAYIDASLATMAFAFALEVQGLSSCCVNWPEIPEKEIQLAKTMGLTPAERPIMLISLGFPDPDGFVASSQKRPLNEIRSYNRL